MKIMKIKISPNGNHGKFEDEGRTLYFPCDECTESQVYVKSHVEDIIGGEWGVISIEGPIDTYIFK